MSMTNSSIAECVADTVRELPFAPPPTPRYRAPRSSQGGGIFLDRGFLSLFHSSMIGCRAWTSGGGLYVEDGYASLDSCILRANVADSQAPHGSGAGAHFANINSGEMFVDLADVSFEENIGDALSFQRTTRGYAKGVRFVGNKGGYSLQRFNAPGPTWLCQPGTYMPSSASLTIEGDFTGCSRYPCAPGYFGRHQDQPNRHRSDATRR